MRDEEEDEGDDEEDDGDEDNEEEEEDDDNDDDKDDPEWEEMVNEAAKRGSKVINVKRENRLQVRLFIQVRHQL